ADACKQPEKRSRTRLDPASQRLDNPPTAAPQVPTPPSWTAIANRSSPNAKMVGCYAALVGPGMRCGSGMGCGGAEEEAVDKLLRPLKNSNRLRHLSIIASNRSSTPKSRNNPVTIAVSPISASSYTSPSALRAWRSAV